MKILTAISVLAISCAAAFAQTVETGFYPAEIRPGGYAAYRVTLKNADGASVNPSDIPGARRPRNSGHEPLAKLLLHQR